MMSYILYRTASALAAVVPPGLAKRIARSIAFLFFLFRPSIRKNVRRNFEEVGVSTRSIFPVFGNFSAAVTDFLRLSPLRRDELLEMCSFSGIENLDRALATGRGAVLFAPHLGPWEIAGACLASHGYAIHTVALEHPSARVTRLFSAKRKGWGIEDYPSRSSAAGLMRALARGAPIVLLIDRAFSYRGVHLRFLGKDVLLPDGHVVLSLRSGAPLVPCCCYYTASGTVEGVIGEPLTGFGPEASPADIANACLARIEGFIKAHPEQWFPFDHLWQEA